jgi:hypothetical protein
VVTNRRLISDPNKYFRVTTFLKRYSVAASRLLYGWCICAHALSYLTSPTSVIRDFSWKKSVLFLSSFWCHMRKTDSNPCPISSQNCLCFQMHNQNCWHVRTSDRGLENKTAIIGASLTRSNDASPGCSDSNPSSYDPRPKSEDFTPIMTTCLGRQNMANSWQNRIVSALYLSDWELLECWKMTLTLPPIVFAVFIESLQQRIGTPSPS